MASIVDEGKNNLVQVPESVRGTIILRGDNNVVVIGEPRASDNVYVEVASNTKVRIGAQCVLGHLFVYAAEGATLEVGDETGFNGLIRLFLHEPRSMRIGTGCLFGGSTDMTVSDMHSIISTKTGARLNPGRDVTLGDRVWMGQNCIVLKGTEIGSGSVIGAGSIVSGKVPANVVAAGNPVRVVRVDATWDHRLLPMPEVAPIAVNSPNGGPSTPAARLRKIRAYFRKRILGPIRRRVRG